MLNSEVTVVSCCCQARPVQSINQSIHINDFKKKTCAVDRLASEQQQQDEDNCTDGKEINMCGTGQVTTTFISKLNCFSFRLKCVIIYLFSHHIIIIIIIIIMQMVALVISMNSFPDLRRFAFWRNFGTNNCSIFGPSERLG